MKSKISTIVIVAACLFCNATLFAQQKFSVKIIFPPQLKGNKISILYDNGISDKKVIPPANKNSIAISDSFYSRYATIAIQLDSNACGLPFYNTFYISDKRSTITFNCEASFAGSHSFPKYNLINAYSIDTISNQFESYISDDQKMLERFTDSISRLTSVDSVTFARDKEIVRQLINKELDFISLHDSAYFSFCVFETQVAPNSFANSDSLLHFYENTFPKEFTATMEGEKIKNILLGRIVATHNNKSAPDFKSTDIYGHEIALTNERGKYVLINLWASWCGPCVAELPAIKKIRMHYPQSQLKIISVSCDHDSLAFARAIKKYNMNWAQIYDDQALIEKYGGASSLPQLFLINKQGKIIYNRNTNPNADSNDLSRLNTVLQDNLK